MVHPPILVSQNPLKATEIDRNIKSFPWFFLRCRQDSLEQKKNVCDKVKAIWLRSWLRPPVANGACCYRPPTLPKEEKLAKTHVNNTFSLSPFQFWLKKKSNSCCKMMAYLFISKSSSSFSVEVMWWHCISEAVCLWCRWVDVSSCQISSRLVLSKSGLLI